jgi:ABC-2 type transport system ATP-binding protein
MGKTILLSSHILPELQEVCSRIGILERGTLVAQGTIPEIMASARDEVEIHLSCTDDVRAPVLLRELPEVAGAELDEERKLVVVKLAADLDLAKLSGHLAGRGVHLRHFVRHEPTLEQVFMKLTKGLVA